MSLDRVPRFIEGPAQVVELNRSTELSIGLAALGGLALVCGMWLLVLKILRRNAG
jgi:hypothetical protein